jgi:flagellin-like protein
MPNAVEWRWRRKPRSRGVSDIIATILLVAIVVVLAAVLYFLVSGLTKGPGNPSLGTALALGTPVEASAGAGATTDHWYNFSVAAASSGVNLGSLQFQVQAPGGAIVPAGAAWTLTAAGLTGAVLGVYSFSSSSWSSGTTVTLTSQDAISLNAVQSAGLSGDTFIVIGTGSYQGSISVSIP